MWILLCETVEVTSRNTQAGTLYRKITVKYVKSSQRMTTCLCSKSEKHWKLVKLYLGYVSSACMRFTFWSLMYTCFSTWWRAPRCMLWCTLNPKRWQKAQISGRQAYFFRKYSLNSYILASAVAALRNSFTLYAKTAVSVTSVSARSVLYTVAFSTLLTLTFDRFLRQALSMCHVHCTVDSELADHHVFPGIKVHFSVVACEDCSLDLWRLIAARF